MRWYHKVTAAPDGDYTVLANALVYYDQEYDKGAQEVKIRGNLEKFSSSIPGLVEYYYGHLQELEAILKFLEVKHDVALGQARRRFLEHYNKQLSDRTAEKYAEVEPAVVDLRLLINEVALVRNRFLGIHKALEFAHFQLTNIRALKVAGIEDASV